jgi:hypothetical protein
MFLIPLNGVGFLLFCFLPTFCYGVFMPFSARKVETVYIKQNYKKVEGEKTFFRERSRRDGSAGFGIRCSDSNALKWSVRWGWSEERPCCIASISPDIASAAKSCVSGGKSVI